MIKEKSEKRKVKREQNPLCVPFAFFAFFAVIVIISGCYFLNTFYVPSPAGFHVADSPFSVGHTISGIASGGEIAVAVSKEGGIAYSSDSGVNWEAVNLENSIPFNAVTWGAGFFLAVGDGGRAAYSSDGINWQDGVIGPMSPKDILCAAAGTIAGRTVFAAAGTDGRLAHALDSPAGPWFMADQSPFGSVSGHGHAIRALAFGTVKGRGVFTAAGDDGRMAYKMDLSGKWYGGRAGTGETFRGLAFGNDRFIAVGDNGLIQSSLDPMQYTWTRIHSDTLGIRPVSGIAFDPLIKHFILYTSDTIVAYSEFGETWRAANFQSRFGAGTAANPERIGAVTAASRIIMGGTRGTLIYSN